MYIIPIRFYRLPATEALPWRSSSLTCVPCHHNHLNAATVTAIISPTILHSASQRLCLSRTCRACRQSPHRQPATGRYLTKDTPHLHRQQPAHQAGDGNQHGIQPRQSASSAALYYALVSPNSQV